MPKEASNHFGSKMLPFVEAIVNSKFGVPYEEMTDLPEEIRNAIITANGELMPNYKYIQTLREQNETLKKQKEEFDKMANDTRKNSSLQRSMSQITMEMKGHLFDTRFFNNSIDILEAANVKFRVLDMQIGNTGGEDSMVIIQAIGKESQEFNSAIQKVIELGENEGVKIQEAMSGPSYQKNFVVLEAKSS